MSARRPLTVVRRVADLRDRVARWRAAGEMVGLVPTMGSLHEGHLSLVRLSRAAAGRTCVTLFVNPTQFGAGEDLDVYPHDEAADTAILEAEGVDLLFAPAVAEMYREGHVTTVAVPGIGDCLEGEFRPGFFSGVATVVTKLLLQSLPDVAFFGEKDYQQLQVIRRLVADLDIPVGIESGRTVRDADGLALSSRNANLSPAERALAPILYKVLATVAEAVAGGSDPRAEAEKGRRRLIEAGFAKVDYVAVRDAATLEPAVSPDRPARVLAAAWLGGTRLIDNVPVGAECADSP